MAELVESVRNKKMENGTVSVTFDDGFADNLHNALPVLQKHGVPATVYVTSGRIGQQIEFWWDELERLVLEPALLPGVLEIPIGRERFTFRLEDASRCTPAATGPGAWQAWCDPPVADRQKLFHALWLSIRRLPFGTKEQVLQELRRWTGLPETGREAYLPLSSSELQELAGSQWVEIGAHTLLHPSLPDLPESEQAVEIGESKRQLEDWVGRPVKAFSYPHGNYTPATARIVAEAGFASSCTTQPIAVTSRSKLYELPRFQALDWDGDQFERQLRHWLKHA
jgi:peptidoglycan/xylan/chitin deacetylase (PgdA/CDA1 family)